VIRHPDVIDLDSRSLHCANNRRQSIKRSCPDSGTSDDEIPYLTRWFVIQEIDDSVPLTSLSAFALGKALKAKIGTLVSVKRLERGDSLVQTDNATYANMLLKVESLAHVPVKVTPHRTLNSCKGVVRSRELASCDVAEITCELKSQGVIDAVIISVKDGSDEERRKTNTVILTFNRPQPPSHITAGYLRIPVAWYIPNPLRCFNCQRYGHGKAHCRRQQTCSRCGEVGYDQPDCRQQEHCINCDGDHAAASKLCPKWKLEKKVKGKSLDT